MPVSNPKITSPPDNLWAELHRLRSDNARQRDQLQEANKLLKRAKGVAAGWYRLHLSSVTIGRLEQIADSGALDTETASCRAMVEQADLLSADITKHIQAHDLF